MEFPADWSGSIAGRRSTFSWTMPIRTTRLRHVIGTVRQVTSGRVIVLFGAGGDRDRTKRPRMAQAAATADSVIVTSDNPRREAPEQILGEIVAGFGESDPAPLVIVDREEAIEPRPRDR